MWGNKSYSRHRVVAAEPIKNLRIDTLIQLILPSRDGIGLPHRIYAPQPKKEPGTY
jgi:hypothetical protein